MKYQKLLYFLQNVGKDPAALIFEDELTNLNNRRFLLSYLKNRIDWKALGQIPISLLMIDIDHFCQINDQYGQNAGDQALIHIAGILEKTAVKEDVAVRYAGDEFVLLLPNSAKSAALTTADTLVSNICENGFFLPDAGKQIPLTVSIGVATAPDDAGNGKLLIDQADTALYQAKTSGRNQFADAAGVSRQAIRAVDNAGIVGRKSQFKQVSGAFKEISTGRNQFVIIDGAPGMGKTSFLDTVQHNLEKNKFRPVRISGVLQESFRPYYLISYAIMVLMNQAEDNGISVLEEMDKLDLAYLSCIMPQLAEDDATPPEDVSGSTDAVLKALGRFLSKLIGNRPLVLLIDDLQYSDPASLDMLRELLSSDHTRLFICATASEEKHGMPQAIPLDLFRTAYAEPLGIVDISLTPLGEEDIKKFINIIFPGITMPKGLAGELADITQGNPLFIGAILRKMITDQKIVQSEHQWTVAKLEKGYFPRSFEEIIQQKLEHFKGDSKQFLDRASAFGETTSLSMLAGFSQQNSTEIYDILKEAVDQGIVRSEFGDNDESIRFSSRRVQEVIYEGILPEERKQLHEKIGLYQEKLYHQNLLPSAAFLVHHFKLSDNKEKARTYEQLMAQFNQRIYDLHDESIEDAEDDEPAAAEAEAFANIPLTDDAMRHVPDFLRAFMVAIRNTRLYPPDSKSVTGAIDKLMEHLRAILSTDERFSIVIEKNLLLANGQFLDTGTFQSVAEKLTELWNRLELKSLTFDKDVSEEELKTLLFGMSRIERKAITPGFWKRFAEGKKLNQITLKQVKYKKIDQESGIDSPPLSDTDPGAVSANAAQFDENELFAIQRVIGTFLGAYSKLKLYPSEGPVAQNAVNHVLKELQAFLKRWPVLSIARVETALLINGTKIDTTAFEALSSGFMKFLKETCLSSISFTSRVSSRELVEVLSTATRTPSEEMNSVFWQKLAAENQITGILFDQSVYGILEIKSGTNDTDIADESAGTFDTPENDASPPPIEERILEDSDLGDVPEKIRQFYLNGEIRQAEAIAKQLAEKYRHADIEGKLRIILVFDAVLIPENWRPNAAFIKLILSPVMELFASEKQPEPVKRLFSLGHRCGQHFIMFGEYLHAAWVFALLQQHPHYEGAANAAAASSRQAQVLGQVLDPKVTDALVQDLKSENRTRQQDAYQLISGLGTGLLPLLIDFIKQEENLRVRRMGAELVNAIGTPGVDRMKQAMIETGRPDERARILDVIDTVTVNLADELAYVFSDTNEAVRRSAFRLAERINSPEVIELLIDYARSREASLAVFSINTLGRIKPPSLVAVLAEIINKSDDSEVLIAACRAMGQIGDAASIDPLSRILKPSRRFLRRKKFDTPVRVAAAYALAQIPGDLSAAILQALKSDPDARIRQVVNRYYRDKN